MTYTDYKKQKQEEVNALPIFWAFSDKQFKRAMEERGLTESDTDKIYAIGNGGFCLKSDAEKVRAFIDKPDELPQLMEQDADFALEAFYYEMCNHEYGINYYQGDWDVCSCFSENELGFKDGKSYTAYLKEAGYSDKIVEIYEQARKKYYRAAEENEWY